MERLEGALVRRVLLIGALLVAAVVLLVPGASLYYETGSGRRCTSCHEMQAVYDQWHSSPHRGIACEKCHGGALTLDASFHRNNAQRAWTHLRGELPEQVRFPGKDVPAMVGQCQSCHRQEFASWQAGPHSATYTRIFLDKKHNTGNMLMDDCMRCHGAYFEGGIGDLVSPVDRKGPWRIVRGELANTPSMPCLVSPGTSPGTAVAEDRCGRPRSRSVAGNRAAVAGLLRPPHTGLHPTCGPAPAHDAGRNAHSKDEPRSTPGAVLSVPRATGEHAGGKRRRSHGIGRPIEGIGCLGCHTQHGQQTRASCASCHPKVSNCGLDVEKMDTTFRSTDSKHNIHWVKCSGCHTNGVPKKKQTVSWCRPGSSPTIGLHVLVPLLELQNVTVQRGDRMVLDGVTLSIAQGEHVAILGPNGSGKSTLIKLISRELYPRQKAEPWSLRILGRDRWHLFDLRNHLGIVSNDWMQMCTRDYSGYEIVLSGFFGSVGIWPNHEVTPPMEAKAREVMELLEIPHLAERNTNEMSSGEARRILIGRALVHDPQALILDEPTTSLDLRATYELREILRKLAAGGISMVMVTHHLPDIIPEIARVVLSATAVSIAMARRSRCSEPRRSPDSSASRWK